MSLPCCPSMKSLPSPPSRRSTPLLPRIVSLPAPPSTVMPISAARLPVALNESSPPFMLTTSCSVVPMSIENGAGSIRSKRTRVPLAVAVKTSEPSPPLTSAVSVPSPPSNRSVSSPGFQIMRSSPPSPKTWSSPSPPVRMSLPAPPNSRSLPPLPSRVSLSSPPDKMSPPEPPLSMSLPEPPFSRAASKAPLASLSTMLSLPARPSTWTKSPASKCSITIDVESPSISAEPSS